MSTGSHRGSSSNTYYFYFCYEATSSVTNCSTSGVTAALATSPSQPLTLTSSTVTPTLSVVGLTPGTLYNFVLCSGTSSTATSDSNCDTTEGSFTTLNVPSAPTIGATPASNANAAATVTWTDPVSNGGSAITGYTASAYVGGVSNGLSCSVALATATSCTVNGLTNGTAYTFAVIAINGVGSSASSGATGVVTPATVPNAPTGAAATSNVNTQSLVTWIDPTNSAPSNGGVTITGYSVQYSSNGGASWTNATSSASGTSYTVTGLTNGTVYTFEVAAINAVGTSLFSSASSGATPATVPNAPTGAAATSNANTQSLVSWTAPANGGATITGYAVRYSSNGGTSWTTATTSATGTTYTVTGLTNGTAYLFDVAATNAAGTGSFSSASSSAIPATVPNAPTGVTATSNANGQSLVTWTAPANGGATITGYSVQYSSNGGTSWTTATTSAAGTSYTVTGLTNSTSYVFRVAATNGVGTGSFSSASTPATPATAPNAPTGVAGTSNANAQSLVTWVAPANGGATITGYSLQYSSNGGTSWTNATSSAGGTSYTVTGLTNGTAYTFEVAATNAAGTGSFSSASSSATPATVPNVPTSVAATSNANGQSLVSWIDPVNSPPTNGGSTITTNSVRYSSNAGATWTTASTSATDTNYLVTGLTNGTAYVFEVAATNAAGTGAFSSASSPATPATVPNSPTGVAATSNANGQSLVTWTAPTNGGASITNYSVQYSSDNGTTWTTATSSASGTSYTVTSLTNGTSYVFRVAATNAAGTSAPSSASSSATPATVPNAPTAVAGTSNANGQSLVTWTDPASSAPTNGGATISGYSATAFLGGASTGLSCSASGATAT
ncbi:MAG TPA: fibronectin type III domain-containing protein, partial [Acidimicrobiales bacterium]